SAAVIIPRPLIGPSPQKTPTRSRRTDYASALSENDTDGDLESSVDFIVVDRRAVLPLPVHPDAGVLVDGAEIPDIAGARRLAGYGVAGNVVEATVRLIRVSEPIDRPGGDAAGLQARSKGRRELG